MCNNRAWCLHKVGNMLYTYINLQMLIDKNKFIDSPVILSDPLLHLCYYIQFGHKNQQKNFCMHRTTVETNNKVMKFNDLLNQSKNQDKRLALTKYGQLKGVKFTVLRTQTNLKLVYTTNLKQLSLIIFCEITPSSLTTARIQSSIIL